MIKLLLLLASAGCAAQRFTLVIERDPSGKVFVNGSTPGPTLRATPGKNVSVLVVNAMPEGTPTTVHWHGIAQTGTPQYDGVLGVTQTPILPGTSLLYEFKPQHPGVYWYHGHHGGQRVDGLYGALLVQQKHVEDVWMAADLFPTPFSIQKGPGGGSAPVETRAFGAGSGSEPVPSALVVNGARAPLRARGPLVLINAAEMSILQVSGPLVVSELDDVATVPFTVPGLFLPPGARAIVGGAGGVTLSIAPGMYPPQFYTSNFTWGGQLHKWAGRAPALSPSWKADKNCIAARPLKHAPAPSGVDTTLRWTIDPGGASVNGASYVQNASAPPVILQGFARLPYNVNGSGAVPFVIRRGAVVDMLVDNRDAGPHAFHLHGYQLWLVASSEAPDAERRLAPHYALRDSLIVSPHSWLRVRFVASNPGAWLAHCHFEAHFRVGLASLLIVK